MDMKPIYPEGIDREAYDKALESCVLAGHRLFNQSDMDVWYDIEGFPIKIPAGTHILPDGWDQVRRLLEDRHTEKIYGTPGPVVRGRFRFTRGRTVNIFDRLVVFSPDSARHWSILYGRPERTLEEHIALINTMGLDDITVVAEDLEFLPRCPGLRAMDIVHAKGLTEPIDFSPLYELPELEELWIDAASNGITKPLAIRVDFERLPKLKRLSLCGKDRFNYDLLPELEELSLANDKRHTHAGELSASPLLKDLDLLCGGLRTLNGIGRFPLQQLNLCRMFRLEDISELRHCAGTLRSLSIDTCPKVRDFSCLQELENLEFLHLHGSNVLPDLSFVKRMPRLKVLNFSMTIADGDLTPCLDLPYATFSKGKRHYNLKDTDLPKNLDGRGFVLI